MPDHLETTVDKFIFRVATDRCYSAEGVWAFAEGDRVRIGLSDFVQQRGGDVAFAEVRPEGTILEVGDEVAVIETIKTNVGVPSPVAGTVAAVNPAMKLTPEAVNTDPYGDGWLALIEARDWPADRDALFGPEAYLAFMTGQAEAEARRA
jgi:glycine cleavage system H protein